jgi:DnaK suppressor protein
MNPHDLGDFSAVLRDMRARLVASARATLGGEVHLNRDDFADEIDSASSESGLAFVGRLREREHSLLQKIEAALKRIELGTFGICVECGDPIAPARLRARPVAALCIDCKAEQEQGERE